MSYGTLPRLIKQKEKLPDDRMQGVVKKKTPED